MAKASWSVLAPTVAHAQMAKLWLHGASAAHRGFVDVWVEGQAVHVEGEPDLVREIVEQFSVWLKTRGSDLVQMSPDGETGEA